MGTTTRTDEGRVRTGVVKIITGYAQEMRESDDRTTKTGNRMVSRSIRVPIKDHPKGGEYHQVQSAQADIAADLAAMPARALVQVTGNAKTDSWVDKQTGVIRTKEVVWADNVRVIELDTRQAPPHPREEW